MVASTFNNSTTTWRWLLQVCVCVCVYYSRTIHFNTYLYRSQICGTHVCHSLFSYNMQYNCIAWLTDGFNDSTTSCQKQNHTLPEIVTAGAFVEYIHKHKLPETVTAVTAVCRIYACRLTHMNTSSHTHEWAMTHTFVNDPPLHATWLVHMHDTYGRCRCVYRVQGGNGP